MRTPRHIRLLTAAMVVVTLGSCAAGTSGRLPASVPKGEIRFLLDRAEGVGIRDVKIRIRDVESDEEVAILGGWLGPTATSIDAWPGDHAFSATTSVRAWFFGLTRTVTVPVVAGQVTPVVCQLRFADRDQTLGNPTVRRDVTLRLIAGRPQPR
jgi:hypothetical protein